MTDGFASAAEELRAALAALDPPAMVRRPGDVAAAARRVLRRLAREPAPVETALPFRADAGQSARRAGRDLEAMHRRMARTGQPSLASLFTAACTRLGLGATNPLRRAGLVACVLAETRPAPAFHDARHTREVLANAIWLAAAEARLPPEEHALLLIAAVTHDIGHDGGTNTRADAMGTIAYRPCLMEDRALGFVLPLAERAGAPAEWLRDLRVMVRQTDIARRGALASLDAGTAPPVNTIPEAEAEWLRARPMVLCATALLADADVLASAGLSLRAQRQHQLRLAREWGRPARDADGLAFLRELLGGRFITVSARQLEPNLRRIERGLAGSGRGVAGAAERGATRPPV